MDLINKAQSEDLMRSLLSSQVYSFDEGLQSKLPEKRGVYAISVGSGEDTKFLWVGMTHKSKRGLRRRVCGRIIIRIRLTRVTYRKCC